MTSKAASHGNLWTKILAVFALTWAGVATPAMAQGSDYHVGPGDILKIEVYRQQDLNTVAQISGAGTIPFGTLGTVAVGDLTPAQVGERIQQGLKKAGVLLDPVVTVSVSEYHARSVSVLGAVTKPGEFALDRGGLTVSEMLARAGASFASGGSLVSITPPPGSGAAVETLHAADLFTGGKDHPLRGGEVIFVQQPALVYVRGEVQRPGAYPIEPNMTLEQAVVLAGGLTQRGTLSGLRVTHAAEGVAAQREQRSGLHDLVTAGDTIIVRQRLF